MSYTENNMKYSLTENEFLKMFDILVSRINSTQ